MRVRRAFVRVAAVLGLVAGLTAGVVVGTATPAAADPADIEAVYSSPNPSTADQPVQLLARVRTLGTPGSVEFREGTTLLGTVPAPLEFAPTFRLEVVLAEEGAHDITATFVPGSSAFETNSATFTHLVSPPGGPVTYRTVGEAQSFAVPPGITAVDVRAVGGRGAGFAGTGGVGAVVEASVPTAGVPELSVRVAGNGDDFAYLGYNGGEASLSAFATGGGASDLRTGGDTVADRVLVAAGGGAAGEDGFCGDPPLGGSAGAPGTQASGPGCDDRQLGRGGGAATAGAGGAGGAGASGAGEPAGQPGGDGSLGQGGAAGAALEFGGTSGGGGGGGLYGGGGGGASEAFHGSGGGGGGGSNLVPDGGTASLDTTGVPLLTITWDPTPPIVWDGGATDDLWHSAENWTTDTVPSSADDAVVPEGFFVAVDADAEVGSLALQSRLSIDAGATLTLGERASSLNEEVSGAGTLVNQGTLSLLAWAGWSGPTLVNEGTLVGAGASASWMFGPLVNTGLVRADAALSVGPVSGAGDYVTTPARLIFRGDGNVLPSGGSLTGTKVAEVNGTMIAESGTIDLDVELLVTGTLTVRGDVTVPKIQVGGRLVLDDAAITGDVLTWKGGARVEGRGGISGALASEGMTVAPDGTLTVGSYEAHEGFIFTPDFDIVDVDSTLEIDIASATEFDRVVVTGPMEFTSITYDTDIAPGYAPAPGDVLRIVEAASVVTYPSSAPAVGPFSLRYVPAGVELYIPVIDGTAPEIEVAIDPPTPASGWHTTDVGVDWTVSDPDGEVTSATGCDDDTIATDGTRELTCSATSAGGTSSETVTIKRDTVAPAITASVVPPTPNGDFDWYTTAPTVSFACSDAAPSSGVASCTAPVTLGSSVASQSVTGTAKDFAGLTSTTAVTGLLVDTIPPNLRCLAATFPVGGSGGTVQAAVTDNESNVIVPFARRFVSTTTVGTFTASLTGSDTAGNTRTVDCPYTVVDGSGPVIEVIVTPEAPASGWHTTDVTVSWSVVDDESEISDTDGCDDVTISTDGVVELTCSATSAGGTSSETVTIQRDATEPTITGSVSPPSPSASGWYLTAPTVSFECDDAPAGVESCSGPTTLDSSATSQSVTGAAVDIAGNGATAMVDGLLVDLVDPAVVCGAPPTFSVGGVGSVSATVTDAHSRPVAGTVSSPANTSTAGNSTAAVTGRDNAGRSTTVQCPYVVQKVPTALQVHRAIVVTTSPLFVGVNLNLGATLRRTDTGAAIVGQPVTFRIGNTVVCTATTNSQGKAMCGGAISFVQAVMAGSYSAAYAGNGTYLPSTSSGPIL